MVQNQVTVLVEPPEGGPSAKLGHWRKAKKVWTSSMISQYNPLRQPRQLAEGVEFPEKNAGSGVFEPSFGGGGPPVGSATRLVAILNHASLPRPHALGNETAGCLQIGCQLLRLQRQLDVSRRKRL